MKKDFYATHTTNAGRASNPSLLTHVYFSFSKKNIGLNAIFLPKGLQDLSPFR